MDEPLEGIAQADALLGRPFPLPAVALPLCRWVDVAAAGEHGAEVAWNLDDTRPGSPGRVALYAGLEPPPAHALADAARRGASTTASRCGRRRCPRRRNRCGP